MADFEPVCGIEYDLEKAGDLGDLIAPPYDVIEEPLRLALCERSPYNIVHLILPQADGSLDRYQSAGRLAARWLDAGILKPSARAFYVLEQRFELGGRQLVRTALFGRMGLAPWRENDVFPHEVTLPRPKVDRLNLYRAMKLQPGPVFSLFEDVSGRAARILSGVKTDAPYRAARGPEGAQDRIWKVTEEAAVEALEAATAGDRFYIADGHHRYETSLAYREELARGGRLPAEHPANFVLAAAVPFSDPGLAILPTHRLLSLGAAADLNVGLEALREDYEVERMEGLDEAVLDARGSDAIAIYAGGMWYGLKMKPAAREALRKDSGELMARLNVCEVRHVLLPHFFEDVDRAVAEEHITYTHDFGEAVRRVDEGGADAAVLLAPLSVREMAAVALDGKTLPPKSTYFYPKIPTGVVLKPLE